MQKNNININTYVCIYIYRRVLWLILIETDNGVIPVLYCEVCGCNEEDKINNKKDNKNPPGNKCKIGECLCKGNAILMEENKESD